MLKILGAVFCIYHGPAPVCIDAPTAPPGAPVIDGDCQAAENAVKAAQDYVRANETDPDGRLGRTTQAMIEICGRAPEELAPVPKGPLHLQPPKIYTLKKN